MSDNAGEQAAPPQPAPVIPVETALLQASSSLRLHNAPGDMLIS